VVGDDAPTFNGMRGGDEHLNLIGRSADISQIGELIHPCFVGRIALATNSAQHREPGIPPEPAPIAARTRLIAPRLPVERYFGPTSPIGVRGGCSDWACRKLWKWS